MLAISPKLSSRPSAAGRRHRCRCWHWRHLFRLFAGSSGACCALGHDRHGQPTSPAGVVDLSAQRAGRDARWLEGGAVSEFAFFALLKRPFMWREDYNLSMGQAKRSSCITPSDIAFGYSAWVDCLTERRMKEVLRVLQRTNLSCVPDMEPQAGLGGAGAARARGFRGPFQGDDLQPIRLAVLLESRERLLARVTLLAGWAVARLCCNPSRTRSRISI